MELRYESAGLPFDDDDATIEAALAETSIPTLMMSMIHMSGDASLLQGDLRPLGAYINEAQGYMSEESKTEVRARDDPLAVAFARLLVVDAGAGLEGLRFGLKRERFPEHEADRH